MVFEKKVIRRWGGGRFLYVMYKIIILCRHHNINQLFFVFSVLVQSSDSQQIGIFLFKSLVLGSSDEKFQVSQTKLRAHLECLNDDPFYNSQSKKEIIFRDILRLSQRISDNNSNQLEEKEPVCIYHIKFEIFF